MQQQNHLHRSTLDSMMLNNMKQNRRTPKQQDTASNNGLVKAAPHLRLTAELRESNGLYATGTKRTGKTMQNQKLSINGNNIVFQYG